MNKFKAAAYLRLSNEDGDKSESDSIASQRVIIENYINNHADLELVESFIDDGYTGTNFNRPSVKRLLQAVEDGKIDCIIVKDFSRFCRDYIDGGYYLERYFPEHGIRFIAINDGYDSNNSTASDEFMMPLKNVINSHYSKDISKKVKSAFKAKQSKGEFVGAFAGYGYMKDPHNKHRLLIDEDAAQIVRRIFKMYISGMGQISIAQVLNDEKIPCPSEYKRLRGFNYRNSKRLEYTSYWTYATIHKMLMNEMYIGNMVQGKNERRMIHGKAYQLDETSWIKVEKTHDAIIELDTWNITQALLTKRTRQLELNSNIGLFAGYIKCGDCGRAFAKVTRSTGVYYLCGSYKRYSKSICTSHEVREDILEKLILDKINEELAKIDIIEIPEVQKEKVQVNKKMYEISLQRLYKLKKGLYEDYKEGVLDKTEYEAYKKEYLQEEAELKKKLEDLNDKKEDDQEKNVWIENLQKFHKLDKLDRATLACVLDSIMVYENDDEKVVDIKLKYSL